MRFKAALLLMILCAVPLFGSQDEKEDEKQLQIEPSQRYLVLDTHRTKTLQRELDQASAAGYRVAYGNASHNILILEKTSGSP